MTTTTTTTPAPTPHAPVSALPRVAMGKLRTSLGVLRAPLRFYREQLARHGDPFVASSLNGKIVVTASQEGARQLLTAPPETFGIFAPEAAASLLGATSLLLQHGAPHRRKRKLLMPAFHGDRMRSYGEAIAQATRRHFVCGLEAGQEFVAQERAVALSLEVIVRVVFGVTDDDEVAEVSGAIERLLAAFKPIFLFSPATQIAPFGLGPWAKVERLRGELDRLLYDRIARARSQEGGEDILGMLIQATDEDGEAMGDEELRDELLTLLTAGHETTALALSWALYHLHRDPTCAQRLRQELADHDDVALAEIPRLPWMKAVVQETLRLHPVLPDFLRYLERPMVLLGHEIPAGHSVAIATTVMHHDPEIYEDPMRFRPARFLDSSPPKWAYFPFGGGHRRCIGAAFASFEMSIALAEILRHMELELMEDAPVPSVRRNITMGPETGVRMRVKP